MAPMLQNSEDSSLRASINASSIISSAKGVHSLTVVVTDTDILVVDAKLSALRYYLSELFIFACR
jgi:hypothetical protein